MAKIVIFDTSKRNSGDLADFIIAKLDKADWKEKGWNFKFNDYLSHRALEIWNERIPGLRNFPAKLLIDEKNHILVRSMADAKVIKGILQNFSVDDSLIWIEIIG